MELKTEPLVWVKDNAGKQIFMLLGCVEGSKFIE